MLLVEARQPKRALERPCKLTHPRRHSQRVQKAKQPRELCFQGTKRKLALSIESRRLVQQLDWNLYIGQDHLERC